MKTQTQTSQTSQTSQTPKISQATQTYWAARDLLIQHRLDYAAAVRDFRWPELDEFNWALDHFDAMALGNERTALHIVEEDGQELRLSFAQMSARSSQVAHFLHQQGVARGDRILVILGNEVALWETMLGAFKLGAVVIPATALLTADDVLDRMTRGEVKHVVVGAAQVGKFAQVKQDFTRIVVGSPQPGWTALEAAYGCEPGFVPPGTTHAQDPLLLYFTSGTTALPKLVLHTHQSYPVGHLSTLYWLGLMPGDMHLNISSPGWAKHAWSSFFAPWIAGAGIFIYNTARFDAAALLKQLSLHPITSLCAAPTVWRLLIQEDLPRFKDQLRLREVMGAGEPLNPEIIDQIQASWGLTLRDGYGQTETCAQIGNSPGQPVKAGSMGRPLPGYHVVLRNPEGEAGDEGEVCLSLSPRPVGLMVGYADSPEKTAEVMRDGHYHCGDVAQRDSEGYITFVGRADDVFKSAGYRISPFEVESALMAHPSVVEVAVVPSPDPVRNTVPKAFVILAGHQTPNEALARDIMAFAKERLAPYKRVRRLSFVTELPKTISGKIRRVQLRQEEAARRAAEQLQEHEYLE